MEPRVRFYTRMRKFKNGVTSRRGKKGPFLNLKKSCTTNGLSANWRLENAKSPAAMLQENNPQTPHASVCRA